VLSLPSATSTTGTGPRTLNGEQVPRDRYAAGHDDTLFVLTAIASG
jgi:hypothetical protein